MDLLENYQTLPEPVQAILMAFNEDADNLYQECKETISRLERCGYTADYDLSGQLFDLKKIKSKRKSWIIDGYKVEAVQKENGSNYNVWLNVSFSDGRLKGGTYLKEGSTDAQILDSAINLIKREPFTFGL